MVNDNEMKKYNCGNCHFWDYEHPEDMGVCVHADGPGDGKGMAVPINAAVLSKHIKTKFQGKQATTYDSHCNRYKQETL